jgi:hypothetical protein
MSWHSWGGQEMSALISPDGIERCVVTLSGRRAQTGVIIQVYDWGEAGKVASKVLDRMTLFIPVPPIPQKK